MSCLQNLGFNAKKRPAVTIEDVEDEGEPSPSHSNDPVDSEGDFVEAGDEPITIIGYLDMQTGLQDSFQHMTLGYQVPRPLGPIKGTMDIIHYLQSCLQRFGEPKLTCLHLFSNILFVFYGLPSFFF